MSTLVGLVGSGEERARPVLVPPVQEFRSPSFCVQEFRLVSGQALPRHAHDRFAVVLQLEGGYTQALGARTFEVSPGDALTVPAQALHSERVGRIDARALIVSPRSSGTTEIPSSLTERPVRMRSAQIRRSGWAILKEMTTADPVSPLAVEGLVAELLVQIMRRRRRRIRHRPPTWLVEARQYLDDCLREPPPLEDLARVAGVSRGHLTRMFRACYGCSIGEYVRARRVDRVASMLRDSDLSICDVALAAGFCDQSHLTREFRRQRGVTPAEYRNGH